MADMIAVRQRFRYRSSSITISALPAIQMDDQVRIWEQTSNEGGLHYVRGITSNNNLESGEWTYDLDTHWLGEDPFDPDKWAFDSDDVAEETREFMDAVRGKTGVGTTNYYEQPRQDTAKMPAIPVSPDGTTVIVETHSPSIIKESS